MRRTSFVSLCVCSVLIAGCTQKPAAIEEKGGEYYGRTSYYPAPLVKKNLTTKTVKVKKGDTLYSIAKKNKVSLRHLMDANKLKPPYIIPVDKILVIPNAHEHKVKYRETLFEVATTYNVSISQLAKINNIKKPYLIEEGAVLTIPIGYKLDESDRNSSKLAVNNNIPKIKIVEKKTAKQTVLANSKPTKEVVKKRTQNSPKVASSSKTKANFIWPIRGRVISRFGPKKGGLYNDGINIAAKEGEPIKAVGDGVVVYSGSELKGYGNLVIIKHAQNYITAYAHNKKVNVVKGQKVKRGQIIAEVGKTGHVTSPQLHFAIRKGRKAVNPKNYLNNVG